MSRNGKPPPLPAALARAAVDSIADAVLIVGADGGVVHLNPAAEELFGRSRERAVELPVRALPGGAQLAVLCERVRSSQESQSIHYPSPQDPGIPIAVEAGPLLDGSACVGTVVVLRIPRASERALDFEALAAGLAHEIRNPLAGLQGSAELLAREAEGPAREYAAVIAREAKRVDGLVRELLDLARPAALQTAAIDLHEIVGDVLVLVRGIPGAERVTFVERYDPSLPKLHLDAEKLTQVLLNLVRNALDAVAGRQGAQIALETGVSSLRLRSASGRTRPLVRLSVQDNGSGIAEPMLHRLFTPFATSKAHGTGLGLAVSRRIVEAHGGRIEVKNRAGGGAEANVYLPLDA
ncbi:nitrogen regulation protein NR(II) [Anaeromyxobacter sp. Fw109-5]|uniref:two-component system sensor histidine kinase NtrB n=1 Tax=Anaeromyxobacter sp. (strain Fw109-5) TaxID=404589 RepID=UPI0000ED6E4C|nr:ATP-binding protein [Anaeromyxobacter sp. Fw109-5]ABS28576.1 signal transduction histidine kinase, nitrogen specific, NtrB [Anaeromyxobacter sp. Fw109-5]